jgi:ATP-dependent helicase HrpB
LSAAFPDRLVRRREPGSKKGVMVGGRGVWLAPTSAVDAELYLAIDVDAGQGEAVVRLASAVQRDWLPASRLRTQTEVAFDEQSEKVTASRRHLFDDLIIEESPAKHPEGEEVAQVLAAAAATRLDRVLPPADSAAGSFLLRLLCLRQWLPELDLPAFDDEELRTFLPELATSCKSFAELRQAPWLASLQARLTSPQRRAVDIEAPERIDVPTGSRITLQYELGRPPVLAVRIQELFGLKETPRVAAGRVRVLLHLLAPNYRPQQVTDDLASFWANTYPVVRKELRARYPKHAWPEDPLTAPPQRGAKRRRRD